MYILYNAGGKFGTGTVCKKLTKFVTSKSLVLCSMMRGTCVQLKLGMFCVGLMEILVHFVESWLGICDMKQYCNNCYNLSIRINQNCSVVNYMPPLVVAALILHVQ